VLGQRGRHRLIVIICTFSLCLNGLFVIKWLRQRSPDYQGMDMFPYYLALAYVSYDVEFNPKAHPNVQSLPGRPMIDKAFSALQASMPLYGRYGYHTGTAYEWIYNLEFMDTSDTTAYRQLSDIKSFLPLKTFIKPSEIQPLFDAITKEYTSKSIKK
jgi:hypothetical protein